MILSGVNSASPRVVVERIRRRAASAQASADAGSHGLSAPIATALVASVALKDLARPIGEIIDWHRQAINAALNAPMLEVEGGVPQLGSKVAKPLGNSKLKQLIHAARQYATGHIFDSIAKLNIADDEIGPILHQHNWSKASAFLLIGRDKTGHVPTWADFVGKKQKVSTSDGAKVFVQFLKTQLIEAGLTGIETGEASATTEAERAAHNINVRKFMRGELEAALERACAQRLADHVGEDALWWPCSKDAMEKSQGNRRVADFIKEELLGLVSEPPLPLDAPARWHKARAVAAQRTNARLVPEFDTALAKIAERSIAREVERSYQADLEAHAKKLDEAAAVEPMKWLSLARDVALGSGTAFATIAVWGGDDADMDHAEAEYGARLQAAAEDVAQANKRALAGSEGYAASIEARVTDEHKAVAEIVGNYDFLGSVTGTKEAIDDIRKSIDECPDLPEGLTETKIASFRAIERLVTQERRRQVKAKVRDTVKATAAKFVQINGPRKLTPDDLQRLAATANNALMGVPGVAITGSDKRFAFMVGDGAHAVMPLTAASFMFWMKNVASE